MGEAGNSSLFQELQALSLCSFAPLPQLQEHSLLQQKGWTGQRLCKGLPGAGHIVSSHPTAIITQPLLHTSSSQTSQVFQLPRCTGSSRALPTCQLLAARQLLTDSITMETEHCHPCILEAASHSSSPPRGTTPQ